MNRREFVNLLGLSPIIASLHVAGCTVAGAKIFPDWSENVPPLATWTYANGDDISTDMKRRSLAGNVCRFPLVSVISMDRKHLAGKTAPSYDHYRDAIRETNPQIKMLAHLNASESHTPSSPGQRVIHVMGGEFGDTGNEPEDNPGTIWFEKPKGRVVMVRTRWGRKAVMDFRKQRARDALFAAMETQYVGGYSLSGPGRWWDGLYLDQLIVPGARLGAFGREREEMVSGLQAVLTRFHNSYPHAIVIGNSPRNFIDINGELNEGRMNSVKEVLSSNGHITPELNIYMYKPVRAATDKRIAIELGRALKYGAFFSYHYGDSPFTHNPWPETFSKLLDKYPKWAGHLSNLQLDS